MSTPAAIASKFVLVDGVRTHYLEAGPPETIPLLLIHSGEFGASAELSWEFNIPALAEHFHVFAPDLIGYGQTDKLFSFTDQYGFRIRHIRRFMDALRIGPAHFIGNSLGGSMLSIIACKAEPDWPIRKMVLVSAGGDPPENEARAVLQTYDGTPEHMARLLDVLFGSRWWDEAYLRRRVESSHIPGAWECAAAARFKAPFRQSGDGAPQGVSAFAKHYQLSYEHVKVPTLVVAGGSDLLRKPGYAVELHHQIPGSVLHVFERARHCPHIEFADEFNKLATEFLR
jgi:pimeloyl-ACP methyl ester carboxylesterase